MMGEVALGRLDTMKCSDPVLVYNDTKGSRQFRHFSLANDIYKQMAQQVFNCGSCLFCRKKRALELASRCVLHGSMYEENCFLTLTYDEKKKTYHNTFQYSDIQKFKKRLRRHCSKKKIEIFNVHEYGRNGKKHWHLIVFNHDFSDKTLFTVKNSIPLYTSRKLSDLWPHGFNTIGNVTEASAMYQAQYMEKDFKNNYVTSEKKSDSKHSGIGKPYFLMHYDQILKLGYIPIGGRKMPIPRYFQRLAHKHFSHFYEKENFFDNKYRKALHRPFKLGEENKKIADLFIEFKKVKDEKIKEYEAEWDAVILQYLTTKQKPDFIKSAENALHDLRNKQQPEKF